MEEILVYFLEKVDKQSVNVDNFGFTLFIHVDNLWNCG